jgi:hypothetical protein
MRKGIIINADKELIYTLCECILNLLNGNINISDEKFNQLKSYKHSFRKILDKKLNLKSKKKLIIQKGGFLEILLPAVISGLSAIISSAISSS